MNIADVPIPLRMAHLPRDPRGYPIPVIVLIDDSGRANFAINNIAIVDRMAREDRCHICGEVLHRARWLVGGPLSAFHKAGRYNDGPLHRECLHYAMLVCPYLAMPNYSGRIDDRRLRNDRSMLMVNTTMMPDRPPLFVAVMTHSVKRERGFFRPRRPYSNIEYWRHGEQLDPTAGRVAVAEHLRLPLPERQPTKVYVRSGARR